MLNVLGTDFSPWNIDIATMDDFNFSLGRGIDFLCHFYKVVKFFECCLGCIV